MQFKDCNLEQPGIVDYLPPGRNKGIKISIRYLSGFKKLSSPIQMGPQIGIKSDNRPLQKIIGNKKNDIGK